MTGVDTELWKESIDSIVEKVTTIVSDESPSWSGTASMLIEQLELEIQAN